MNCCSAASWLLSLLCPRGIVLAGWGLPSSNDPAVHHAPIATGRALGDAFSVLRNLLLRTGGTSALSACKSETRSSPRPCLPEWQAARVEFILSGSGGNHNTRAPFSFGVGALKCESRVSFFYTPHYFQQHSVISMLSQPVCVMWNASWASAPRRERVFASALVIFNYIHVQGQQDENLHFCLSRR